MSHVTAAAGSPAGAPPPPPVQQPSTLLMEAPCLARPEESTGEESDSEAPRGEVSEIFAKEPSGVYRVSLQSSVSIQ